MDDEEAEVELKSPSLEQQREDAEKETLRIQSEQYDLINKQHELEVQIQAGKDRSRGSARAPVKSGAIQSVDGLATWVFNPAGQVKPPKNKVTVNGGDESSGADADGEATDGETKTDAEDGKRTAVTPKQSLRSFESTATTPPTFSYFFLLFPTFSYFFLLFH